MISRMCAGDLVGAQVGAQVGALILTRLGPGRTWLWPGDLTSSSYSNQITDTGVHSSIGASMVFPPAFWGGSSAIFSSPQGTTPVWMGMHPCETPRARAHISVHVWS